MRHGNLVPDSRGIPRLFPFSLGCNSLFTACYFAQTMSSSTSLLLRFPNGSYEQIAVTYAALQSSGTFWTHLADRLFTIPVLCSPVTCCWRYCILCYAEKMLKIFDILRNNLLAPHTNICTGWTGCWNGALNIA